jgi:putative serine protease PepD
MRALGALLAVLALLVAGCGDNNDKPPASSSSGSTEKTQTRVEVIKSIGEEGGFDPKAIYKSESPSVVTVVSLFGSGGLSSLLNGGGGDDQGGVGSGFVLDGNGQIATNAHVVTTGEGDSIRRARQVYVEFADGNTVQAKILGADPNADVALLQIDPKGLTLRPMPLGSSDSVEVGEPVAAIGSPFGERQSLSVGVVSAVDRSIESLTSFSISGAIQTDAAINPGNSGGALVNTSGEVIGINTAIATNGGSSGNIGVGFAISANKAKSVAEQLMKGDKVTHPFLGVSVGDADTGGAQVGTVTAGSPAEKAGLKVGDVITKIGDEGIANSEDLVGAVQGGAVGESVQITVTRDGKTMTVTAVLSDAPSN